MIIQESYQKKIRLVFKIALSIQVAVVGICLILSCLTTYHSGESPFTVASIAAQFAKISLSVYLFLFGICFGEALAIVMPLEEARPTAKIDAAVKLKRCYQKLGNALSVAPDFLKKACEREKSKRLAYRIGCSVICVAATLPLVLYLFDLSHFTTSLNESVIAATVRVIPFVTIGGVSYLVMCRLINVSLQRELKLVESMMEQTDCKGSHVTKSAVGKNEQMRTVIVRAVLLVVAIAMICLGVANGGMRDVLGKAIKICTECIGLG